MKEFKIYKQKIPHDLIDSLIDEHKRFKSSPFSIFRAQGSAAFESPCLDKFGNQSNSIQNPHMLGFSKLRAKTLNILHHENISQCLKDFFDKDDDFVHWQSMFFDISTATNLHQDTWYLDTKPKGNLVGVWIALEDIYLESGPFCVYPKTGHKLIDFKDFDFNNLENDKNFIRSYPKSSRYNFLAKKGDILIWNSYILHGALPRTSEKLTRKSLTSHYYPVGEIPQDAPVKRFFSIYDHSNPRTTSNPQIKTAARLNPYLYSLICIAMKNLHGYKDIFMNDNKFNKQLKNIRNIE